MYKSRLRNKAASQGEYAMNLKSTSKYLSLILRHKPEAAGITLDEHGWADVEKLWKRLSQMMKNSVILLTRITVLSGRIRDIPYRLTWNCPWRNLRKYFITARAKNTRRPLTYKACCRKTDCTFIYPAIRKPPKKWESVTENL